MTPEQSKAWFDAYGDYTAIQVMYEISFEELYQAFEARLLQTIKREAATNIFPHIDEVKT